MIPIGVDRTSRTTPYATHLLVVANALIFLVVSVGLHRGGALESLAVDWMTWGTYVPGWGQTMAHPWTLLTYAFLHDPSGLAHVAFNMLFLWVFGRSVEGRLGSWWFLGFYLAGAVAAAIGQWAVDGSPVIGASGAVAAVTAAFAALCPRARVRLLVFFWLIDVSGIALVILFVAIDLLGQFGLSAGLGGRVAYSAHLAGYAFGITVMMALLALKILPRTEFDLLYLAKQWRRRREMRAVLSGSHSPWRRDALQADARASAAAITATQPDSPRDPALELDHASAAWAKDNFASAAARWERFARVFPTHPDADGALLLAAIAHGRKLANPARARELVEQLLARVPQPLQSLRSQAHDLLAGLAETDPRHPLPKASAGRGAP